jgi:hypothetical protein
LLLDGIRVIIRLLQAGKALNPTPWYTFADHQRAAKKRGLQILNARKDQVRLKAYRESLSLAKRGAKSCTPVQCEWFNHAGLSDFLPWALVLQIRCIS